jgi:hypothetical protein
MSTDRPDFTEATDTVPRGVMQFEGGFLLSSHALESGLAHDVVGPSPLIRIGLSRFAELRFGSDGFTRESVVAQGPDTPNERHTGLSDLEIGVKLRLWKQRKYTPAFAVIGALSVPNGSSYFSSGGRDPILDLCWSKALPKHFDVGGNVNFRRFGADGHIEKALSLSAGRILGHGFGMYGEVYRISPIDDDEPAHLIANTGITKLLGPNTQIDLEVGHTVNARTPYWFVGAGFAIRMSRPGFAYLFRRRRFGSDRRPGSRLSRPLQLSDRAS